MERICRYLQQVAAVHPVSLVSVIGGSFFLDFVAAVDFTKIILFDKNVAEFSKICAFCNILSRDPAADPVGGLEREILAAPERLLPSLPSSNLSVRPGPESDWKFEGRSEPAFPLVLRQGNFPEYAWSANEEERRRTLANLRRALAKDVYLEVPEVDADGHLVVVFCSNANTSELPDYYIRPRFQNAAGVLIVRSIVVNDNEAALDPHPYWEAIARSQCTGRSHQLWAPEDRFCLDTPLDETTDTSSILGEEALPGEADTLLCHILSGKCGGNFTGRFVLIRQTLLTLPVNYKRVVIAEFRPEGPAARRLQFGFRSSEDFTNFYKSALPQFDLTRTCYAPGSDDERRNAFLVFDRREESLAEVAHRVNSLSLGLEPLYFVEEFGFHPPERIEGGRLRWTKGSAELRIPEQVEATFNRLDLQLWPLHPAGHEFRVRVNGDVVFEGVVDSGLGFSGVIDFPEQAVRRIDIDSEIIVYRNDLRSLGVALRRLDLSLAGAGGKA